MTTDFTALVVDDEPLLRRDLARLLAALPGVTVLGEAAHGVAALEEIERLAPDVVFLDVQMPELDGLGVVAALDPARAPLIVFVTAYDRYALQAFEAQAVDSLLKPFDPARLGQTVGRVRERLAGSRALELARVTGALHAPAGGSPRYLDRIAARGARATVVVPLVEVHWIEAADNYVRLHTPGGIHATRRTMRDLEQLLDPATFARIHRSTIVRLDQVRDLRPLGDGDWEVRLKDGTPLTLTRSYKDGFEARLGGIA